MAITTIPILDAGTTGAFSFTVELEGVDFQFDFQYNDRERAWYFDLLDANANMLRAGIKCVIDFPLLRLYRSLDRPAGEVMVISTTSDPVDPTLDDFGIDNFLTYLSESELI